jgi:hypothetical protein
VDGRIILFGELAQLPLIVDAIYQGDRRGSAADDPLPRLLDVSNQGGFRYRGNLDHLELVVLKTSFDDPNWPDALDRESGTFIYFGDNKRPGRSLHDADAQAPGCCRAGSEKVRAIRCSCREGSALL